MRQLNLSADTGRTWMEIMTFRLYIWGKSYREKNDPDVPVVTEIYNLNIGTNCVTRKLRDCASQPHEVYFIGLL